MLIGPTHPLVSIICMNYVCSVWFHIRHPYNSQASPKLDKSHCFPEIPAPCFHGCPLSLPRPHLTSARGTLCNQICCLLPNPPDLWVGLQLEAFRLRCIQKVYGVIKHQNNIFTD